MPALMAPPRLVGEQAERARCRRRARAPLLGLLALALAPGIVAVLGLPVWAQLSPNCLRDGKPLACAITPGAEASILTVMYADHAAYRLIKEEAGCRQRGTVRACPATIVPRNGFGPPIAARYVGTAYEGGYRHEYRSRELAITYFFVD